MPIDTIALINVASELTERNDVQIAIKESMKGGLTAGCCAFVGGVLGGPAGIAIGGILGSFVAAGVANGKFKSLSHVIAHELTQAQRDALANKVYRAVEHVGIEDLTLLLPLLLKNQSLQAAVMKEILNFATNDLRLALANRA